MFSEDRNSVGTPAPLIEPQSARNVKVGRHILELWTWTYFETSKMTIFSVERA